MLNCGNCDAEVRILYYDAAHFNCGVCWPCMSEKRSIDRGQRTQWHEKDAVVVWENPTTGEVNYPDKNSREIPQRLRERGFERKEMRSLREVERFEKTHNVVNHAMWYDGSGHSHDGI